MVALSMVLSLVFYLSIPIKSYQAIYVPSGPLQKLTHEGLGLNRLDVFILRLMSALGVWKKPKSGYIFIPTNAQGYTSKGDFLYALSLSKAFYQNATLIPGETLYFFLQKLAQTFHLKVSDLQKAYETHAPYKEAGIVPDTYRFAVGVSADKLIEHLIKHASNYYQNLSHKLLGHYDPKQWERTLIIASIIQKEAANTQEMPLIAGVIFNRLRQNMPLQMDGSLNYGKYSHTKVTRERILEDTSSYNTYKHKGLPKDPVGSVSEPAIKAALFPAKTKYLYFVKNKAGVHVFSQHYKDHVRNIHLSNP
ncbi:endolytic transglycosylase MltG [Helicobacter bizzozeronii]|uniref:endolytic transglycosylase MltG n=1 Tax=Helicobacter bizzozeronii TaxID=56877 RepID=UPI000CEDFE29|nr:endolytic transglycosylase MltG [Helicobacter bizzozeronii]